MEILNKKFGQYEFFLKSEIPNYKKLAEKGYRHIYIDFKCLNPEMGGFRTGGTKLNADQVETLLINWLGELILNIDETRFKNVNEIIFLAIEFAKEARLKTHECFKETKK